MRLKKIIILICLLFSGCADKRETTKPIFPIKNNTLKVSYDSFVNVNYGKRRSLLGWQTTEQIIQKSLESWFVHLQIGQRQIDGSGLDLKNFLMNLSDPNQCDISIVYLGSMQDQEANWEFVDGSYHNWHSILNNIQIPKHPNRIFIIDSCHSQILCPIFKSKGYSNLIITTALAHQKTYQFEPLQMRPIDIKKYFPQGYIWAQNHLNADWGKSISFLGLVWLQTAAKTQSPPTNTEQWKDFALKCQLNINTLKGTLADKWLSTISTCN